MPTDRATNPPRRTGLPSRLLRAGYRLLSKVVPCDVTHLLWLDGSQAAAESPPDPAAVRGSDLPFEFRLLSPEEVDLFCQDPGNDLPQDFRVRARSGRDLCFAALCEGRLAAYAWYALGSIEQEHNRGDHAHCGVAISFPDDVAFLYKGYVRPDYRGRAVYAEVMSRGPRALAAYGVTKILSTAEWSNVAALKSCQKVGYEDLGLICKVGWGRFTMTRIPPGVRERTGARFGHEAMVVPRLPHPALPDR